METYDVIILGAGIVGAATAYECSNAGMRVCIVEPAVPAGAASAAGMGHLVVMDDSPAQLALTRYSREIWRGLRSALPPNVEYEECGTLWVAADADEMAEVYSKKQTCNRCGVDAEVLDEASLRDAEPTLRAGLAGGLRIPNDGVIYPPAAAGYFLSSAQQHGATLIRGKRAVRAAAGEVLLGDTSRLKAGRIVIATGIDTALCPWLNIQPRKGHLVITDRHPGILHHQLVELGYLKSAQSLTEDSVAFNLQPRKTGQLLIGSSRQYGNVSSGVDKAMLRKMLDRAVDFVPALGTLSAIRVWTGFRAATPDKLPFIGPTRDPSVLVAMGFEGLGITNAPGAARLVLHHLTGQELPLDSTPYLPERIRVAEELHA
jgi:glycine/D-amino acid oxidase-like deaminating enzyme